MKVCLTSITAERGNIWGQKLLTDFQQLAAVDKFRVHQFVNCPDEADIILAIDIRLIKDWKLKEFFESKIYKEYKHKLFIYDERDIPRCFHRGLYASMPKSLFISKYQESVCYPTRPMEQNFTAEEISKARNTKPEFLFSFIGSNTHRIRNSVLNLKHNRANIKETKGFMFHQKADNPNYLPQTHEFLYSSANSKFVICPRGAGPNSFRLYETMQLRRVPVVISDQWQEITNIDWKTCCIRIRQKDINRIPQIIEEKEEDWEHMSNNAYKIFNNHFASDVFLHHWIESCARLLSATTKSSPIFILSPKSAIRSAQINSRSLYHKTKKLLKPCRA